LSYDARKEGRNEGKERRGFLMRALKMSQIFELMKV
jgi:hypothetical protein